MLATRKGLRNQLKGLLWRNKSGTAASLASAPEPQRVPASSASGPSYGAASVEGQMRALADLAFMMQDYELAATTLRTLASDLKADKAWKHYAGCQVLLHSPHPGICCSAERHAVVRLLVQAAGAQWVTVAWAPVTLHHALVCKRQRHPHDKQMS